MQLCFTCKQWTWNLEISWTAGLIFIINALAPPKAFGAKTGCRLVNYKTVFNHADVLGNWFQFRFPKLGMLKTFLSRAVSGVRGKGGILNINILFSHLLGLPWGGGGWQLNPSFREFTLDTSVAATPKSVNMHVSFCLSTSWFS